MAKGDTKLKAKYTTCDGTPRAVYQTPAGKMYYKKRSKTPGRPMVKVYIKKTGKADCKPKAKSTNASLKKKYVDCNGKSHALYKSKTSGALYYNKVSATSGKRYRVYLKSGARSKTYNAKTGKARACKTGAAGTKLAKKYVDCNGKSHTLYKSKTSDAIYYNKISATSGKRYRVYLKSGARSKTYNPRTGKARACKSRGAAKGKKAATTKAKAAPKRKKAALKVKAE
jgi:hypothetical protein